MTVNEAINYLEDAKIEFKIPKAAVTARKTNEALDMAIKALEQKPYEKFESAKDHIYKLAGDYKCWDNRLTKDEAVELCHILEQQPCEDAVSRDDVIKAIDRHTFDTDDGLCLDEDISIILEELSSVKPVDCIAKVNFSKEDMQEIVDKMIKEMIERKKGKWINKSHTIGCGIKFAVSECTCCGKKTFFDCDQLVYNYCPNCGAKMGSK